MNSSPHEGGSDGQDERSSEAELSERRNRLNRILDEQRRADNKAAAKANSGAANGYAQAMKLSAEFIAGILVGSGIGWVLDKWLGTSPLGLIVFLLLGFAAGVLNVLRSAGYVAEPGSKDKTAKSDPDR